MNLVDLVPSLKRAVAGPGQFDALFPESTDDDLTALLGDAVSEAQLDGFMGDVDLDTDTNEVTDLTSGQKALVVIYGAARILTAQLANLKNRARYKAGSVESETETSSSILVELLRQASARKIQIREDARYGNGGGFTMVDLYVTRSVDAQTPDWI